jgi:hypothetical protein
MTSFHEMIDVSRDSQTTKAAFGWNLDELDFDDFVIDVLPFHFRDAALDYLTKAPFAVPIDDGEFDMNLPIYPICVILAVHRQCVSDEPVETRPDEISFVGGVISRSAVKAVDVAFVWREFSDFHIFPFR